METPRVFTLIAAIRASAPHEWVAQHTVAALRRHSARQLRQVADMVVAAVAVMLAAVEADDKVRGDIWQNRIYDVRSILWASCSR